MGLLLTGLYMKNGPSLCNSLEYYFQTLNVGHVSYAATPTKKTFGCKNARESSQNTTFIIGTD